jgi:hypothetical protein
MGPLGDERDERASYGAVGLELDPRSGGKRRDAPDPEAWVEKVGIKWDTETDDARNKLIRWLRTGERGVLDEGLAWADHLRDRYTPRSDGWDGAKAGLRQDRRSSDERAADGALAPNRVVDSHVYGEGLVVRYYLRGDPEDLAAAEDLAEWIEPRLGALAPGDTIIEVRCFGRPFSLIGALVEATGKERWRALLARMAENAFSSPTRDRASGGYPMKLYIGDFDLDTQLPKGISLPELFPKDAERGYFVRGPRKLSVKGERAAFAFQDAELAHALARAFEITGDERARQALLGIASFWREEGLVTAFFDPRLELTPPIVLPYAPEPRVGHYAQPSSPLFTSNLVRVMAESFAYAGDREALEFGKRLLRLAALRGYSDLRPIGPAERTVRMTTRNGWADGWEFVALAAILGQNKDRFASPPPVRDLVAGRSERGPCLRFVAPADAHVVRYVVLASPLPIVTRGDGSTRESVFSAVPIAVATAHGGREEIVLPATAGTVHVVVRAEDEHHALSPCSNEVVLRP